MKNIHSIGFFIADEGYGHAVREITVIRNIIRCFPDIEIHIYSGERLSLLKSRLGNSIKYHYLSNLVRTFKTRSGGLDVELTNSNFIKIARYDIHKWFEEARLLNAFSHDILVSDSIPQLTLAKDISDALFINIAHFTWDWFWMNLQEKDPIELSIFLDLYSKFDHYFFGPLTPDENISLYRPSSIHRIGLVLQNQWKPPLKDIYQTNTFKCLLMDNGTHTLSNLIEKALPDLSKSSQFKFFVGIDTLSEKAINSVSENSNMIPISGLKKMHETMIDSDFVVARGGSNTIAEVIAYKIPALLIKETDNPEISSNLDFATSNNFCKAIDPCLMNNVLLTQIEQFISNDYSKIYHSLLNSNITTNGEIDLCQILTKLVNS